MSALRPKAAYTSAPAAPPNYLRKFAGDLKTALDDGLPLSRQNYDKVAVLAFHWENDDMGVVNLERRLLEVFTQKYHYTTDSYAIPTTQPANSLITKLLVWSNCHGGPRTLRIYVYSGHASSIQVHERSEKWHIGGKADVRGNLVGPRVDWFEMKSGIETKEGDICYIFDCCSAASLALREGPETLAASGWDQTAGSSLNFSFTQAFIDALVDLDGKPDTLAGIFAQIFRHAYQNQASSCPVHIPKLGSPSVTIAPLGSGPGPVTRSQARTEHRVLLSVSLDRCPTPLDLGNWKKWLVHNIPSEVVSVDVKIESVFKGSGVFLITVPVEIWTMLPSNDPSIRFVAHVSSNNILPELEGPAQSTLPLRPPRPADKENQPFSHHQGRSIG